MYDQLFTHIRRFVALDDAEEQLIRPALKWQSVSKRDFLLKEGQTSRACYFVVRGCLRFYFQTEQGQEQTTQFAIENWWITDYQSLGTGSPSCFNIQAVESTDIIILEMQAQEALFKELPQLERYFRLILQRAYAASMMRIHYIFTESGEERYHHFTRSFPEFVQRIPQYMLASYLGFTPEFLSKIRARKN